MWRALKMFKEAHLQTKLFILTFALYMIALIWTTVQAYVRLEYNRSDEPNSTVIYIHPSDHS
jgi:hypothetical protein